MSNNKSKKIVNNKLIIFGVLIVLLIVGIILGIKLIITIDEVNAVIEDIRKKVKSLDGIFSIVDIASNKLGLITSRISDWTMSLINKIVSLRNRKDEDEDYE